MSDIVRWWEWRKRAHCPHAVVRGISGDETWYTPGFRRLECRRCGRFLDGPVAIAATRTAATKTAPESAPTPYRGLDNHLDTRRPS